MRFGKRLRELRIASGLTQEALAEKAGLHRMAVAKIEVGQRDPTWATATALARALGVSCEVFEEVPTRRPASKKKKGESRR